MVQQGKSYLFEHAPVTHMTRPPPTPPPETQPMVLVALPIPTAIKQPSPVDEKAKV